MYILKDYINNYTFFRDLKNVNSKLYLKFKNYSSITFCNL